MRKESLVAFGRFPLLLLLVGLTGCAVHSQNLETVEVLARAAGEQCCPEGDCATQVTEIAYHGNLPELLNIAVGPVSGDVKHLKQQLRSVNQAEDIQRLAVYSDSNYVSSHLLATALSGFESGELAKVQVCWVGDRDNFARIRKAGQKAGIAVRRVSVKDNTASERNRAGDADPERRASGASAPR